MICAVVSVVIDWRAESAAGAGTARASSGANARAERKKRESGENIACVTVVRGEGI